MTRYNRCLYRFSSLVTTMTPDTPMPVSAPNPKYAARLAKAEAAKAEAAEPGDSLMPQAGQPETFAAYYK